MSLISEALNKVQLQQQNAGSAYSSYQRSTHRHQPAVRVKSLTFIWANAAVLTVFFIGGLIYLKNRPYPSDAPTPAKPTASTTMQPTSLAPASMPIATAEAPKAVSTATASNDFTAPAAYSSPAPSASAEYDLAGMSALGNSTLLSISRRSDHRSIWVQVGKSVGEITAVSYDPDTDSAKISVNGRVQTIKMRDGSAAIAAE